MLWLRPQTRYVCLSGSPVDSHPTRTGKFVLKTHEWKSSTAAAGMSVEVQGRIQSLFNTSQHYHTHPNIRYALCGYNGPAGDCQCPIFVNPKNYNQVKGNCGC